MAGNRKLLVTAVVCVTAIAGLTGCAKNTKVKDDSADRAPTAVRTSKAPVDPFAGLTADQIAEKAVSAMKGAKSLRGAGRIKSDGEQMTADFAVDTEGSCVGTIEIGTGKAELLRADEVMYMKGDEKFWRASMKEDGTSGKEADGVVELLKGRWVKMGADEANDMGDVCEFDTAVAETSEDRADRKGMTKGPDSEVNGQSTVTLVKKKATGETITMYVAKEGKPYLLKMVKVGGDEPGTMVFTDYDKPVKAVAPPADQIVDLEKLGGGSSGSAA
jgi:hypothetical protein